MARGSIRHIEPLLPGTLAPVSETVDSSAASAQSLAELINSSDALACSQVAALAIDETISIPSVSDDLTSSAESDQTLVELGYSGETNTLDSVAEATMTILDYVISDNEDAAWAGAADVTIVEVTNSADTLTSSAESTQDDFTKYETFDVEGDGSQVIDDIVDGSVIEIVDAGSGADSTGVGGYNVSGLNVPSLLDDSTFVMVDTTEPSVDSIYGSGSMITIVFSETLDAGSIPSPSDFSVTVNGSPCSVTAVSIDLNQVTLTLGCTISNGDVVVVTYTKPGSGTIQDPSGNQSPSFTSGSAATPSVDTTDAPPDPADRPGTTGPSYGAHGISLDRVRFRTAVLA